MVGPGFGWFDSGIGLRVVLDVVDRLALLWFAAF